MCGNEESTHSCHPRHLSGLPKHPERRQQHTPQALADIPTNKYTQEEKTQMLKWIPNQSVLVYDTGDHILTIEDFAGSYSAWLRRKGSKTQKLIATSSIREQATPEFINELESNLEKYIAEYDREVQETPVAEIPDFDADPTFDPNIVTQWNERTLRLWANALGEYCRWAIDRVFREEGENEETFAKCHDCLQVASEYTEEQRRLVFRFFENAKIPMRKTTVKLLFEEFGFVK